MLLGCISCIKRCLFWVNKVLLIGKCFMPQRCEEMYLPSFYFVKPENILLFMKRTLERKKVRYFSLIALCFQAVLL